MRQPVPLVGGYGVDTTRHYLSEDTLNYLPAKSASGGSKTPFILRQAPGLRPLLDTQDGPIRGMAEVEGRLYVVSGTQLYQVQPNLLQIPCGTIPGVGRVSMAHNQRGLGNELAIDNGSARYVLNTATLEFGRVTDEAFPGSFIAFYVDQYLGYVEPQGRFWGHSDLADALSYNSLDTYEAEGDPDRIVTAHVSHREVLIFGRTTIEPFVNSPSGSGIAPFVRASNTVIETGCAARYSVASMDGAVFWLDDKRIVRQMNGYQAQRVSNEWVEQALAECSAEAIADAYAFTWEDKGFKVYYLTIPGVVTFGYDLTSGEWARRSSPGLQSWRLNSLVFWNGQWVGGDIQDGKLYALDWNYFRDGQDELVRERSSGVQTDNQNAMMVHGIELLLGVGGPESDVGEFYLSPLPPSITGDAPGGASGAAYSYSYTVTGSATPLEVAVVSGSLPPGVSMSTAGVLSGTLSVGGVYSWTVRVTDNNGQTDDLEDTAIVTSSGAAIWFVGKVAENGAAGGSQDFYAAASTAAGLASATPTALPANGSGSITRLSTANGRVFMHRGTAGSVSADGGVTWAACNIALNSGTDVFWNGTNYWSGLHYSADGITWSSIPNQPTSSLYVVLARASDGIVVMYAQPSGTDVRLHTTANNGASWTQRRALTTSFDASFATDGTRIWWTENLTGGRVTADLFTTVNVYGDPANADYQPNYGDGWVITKGFNGRVIRTDATALIGTVILFGIDAGARADATIRNAVGTWAILDKTAAASPNVWRLNTSTDDGANWTDTGLDIYGGSLTMTVLET